MIRSVAIIGTGLIGTSIGLAMRRHGTTVYLLDRDDSAARTAAALGAGVADTPPQPVDLAVIAVPPHAVADVLAEHGARELARSYTDVASVKALPARQIGSRIPDASRYVGGHPMAGRERSGPLAARADLFEGRPWVLTPSPETSPTTLDRALHLVALCGAVPLTMDGDVHDRAVALTSHAPQVVASLMAARLEHRPHELLQLAGQGLRDTTRIAGSDALLWADILSSNAEPVARVLRELEKDLAELLTALDELADHAAPESVRRVIDLLERGASGARAIRPNPHAGSDGPRVLHVPVGEESGELSRLLEAVADHGVPRDDVRAFIDADQDRLTIEFPVPPTTVEHLRHRLAQDGWHLDGTTAMPRLPAQRQSHPPPSTASALPVRAHRTLGTCPRPGVQHSPHGA